MSNSPAFFYLDPLDQAAAQIVSLPVNLRFKHILVEGRACLRVGVDHVPKRPGQLISFGRNPSLCDIALPQDFPGTQCHFSINPQSGELLLRDDTEDMSTLLSAPSTPEDQRLRLPDSRPRQRVVLTTEKGNLIRMKNAQFLLLWSERATRERALEEAKNKAMIGPGVALNLGSDLGLERGQIIHSRIAELGKGVTATVFKTLNLNTGDHLAVKSFHFESPKHQDAVKVVVRKEVVLLSQLSHVRSDLVEDFLNIAVFLHAQGWEPTKRIEIFMVAYPRSLHDRLLQYRSSTDRVPQPHFFPRLVKQMLHALFYLHNKTIIHRDIKPENILCNEAGNFYLADFGMSKTEDMSNTCAGSLEYVAPEIFQGRLQTTKVDVWSMGVLVLLVLDSLPRCPRTWEELKQGDKEWFRILIERAAVYVPQILPMLRIEPRERCSALICLQTIFETDSKMLEMPLRHPNLPGPASRAISQEPGALLGPQTGTVRANVDSAVRANEGTVRQSVGTGAVAPTTSSELVFHMSDLSLPRDDSRREFPVQAARSETGGPTQAPAPATASADSPASHGGGQAPRQGDQLRRERIGGPSPPSQLVSATSRYLAGLTEGRRARQGAQPSAPQHGEQHFQGNPTAQRTPWQLGAAQLATSAVMQGGQDQQQRHQLQRERPTRQSPQPQRTPSESAGLAEMRSIGEAHRRGYRQAERRALQHAEQSPPSRPAMSKSEELAEIRSIGEAHRQGYRQAEQRALQQAQLQPPQQAQLQPPPRAQQQADQPVRGTSALQQDRRQPDQTVRTTSTPQQDQRQRDQPLRGVAAGQSAVSSVDSRGFERRSQAQRQRERDGHPPDTSARQSPPSQRVAAQTTSSRAKPTSSAAHPTSSPDRQRRRRAQMQQERNEPHDQTGARQSPSTESQRSQGSSGRRQGRRTAHTSAGPGNIDNALRSHRIEVSSDSSDT